MSRKTKIFGIIFSTLIAILIVLYSTGIILLSHDRERIVKSLSQALRKYYVIEEDAIKMADLIERNCSFGKYWTGITTELLWKHINGDLHSICNDDHLFFVSSPDMVEYARNRIANIDIYNEADKKESEKDNHGIIEVKIIEPNIGYLRLDRFANPIYGEDNLLKSLESIKNATSMIIDLRYNNGGVAEQAQLLFSYFVPPDDSMLISVDYYRFNDSIKEFWTLSNVEGRSFDPNDVYVLISSYTFSAAEGFAYDMKHHNKGIILGETSKGGAHPVDWKIIEEDFVLRVPVGRGIHPVTGKDWEGIGVIPDAKVECDKALDEALRLIRENKKATM